MLTEKDIRQHPSLRLYSINALARELGVQKAKLKKRLIELEVPTYYVGQHPRYLMSEVLESVQSTAQPQGGSLIIEYDQPDHLPGQSRKGR